MNTINKRNTLAENLINMLEDVEDDDYITNFQVMGVITEKATGKLKFKNSENVHITIWIFKDNSAIMEIKKPGKITTFGIKFGYKKYKVVDIAMNINEIESIVLSEIQE